MNNVNVGTPLVTPGVKFCQTFVAHVSRCRVGPYKVCEAHVLNKTVDNVGRGVVPYPYETNRVAAIRGGGIQPRSEVSSRSKESA